ncbi:hypothetical protein QFZ75_003560 [Streptomyces sp. V3I8]|uniref:hypothetical protein n=1 Tax=Streptomyces sp. V3I8 TaxID=3042279 RepID=UPI00277D7E06|nr:hypothetical protein [Streptomyces sp. V3I8]MDQ1037144.1 hypothetical protein [Streptomyces sp. V3I8]
MPAIALFSALLVVGFEQFVEWRFGLGGAVGLLLLTVGLKVRSPTCSSVGAVVLALIFTGPAL